MSVCGVEGGFGGDADFCLGGESALIEWTAATLPVRLSADPPTTFGFIGKSLLALGAGSLRAGSTEIGSFFFFSGGSWV